MEDEIKRYYDELATEYDENRFGNSYGRFIDAQEKLLLDSVVDKGANERILDMGCGTGRFLPYASHGIDISPKMIAQSRQKFPDKKLKIASGLETGFEDAWFDKLLSFHVLMHLNPRDTKAILKEAHRILKPGGQFIFDVPSKKRRRLTNYKAQNWHAANAFSLKELKSMTDNQWHLNLVRGIVFLPIHRFPNILRKPLLGIDALLNRSIFKEYASYLVIVLEKS